MNKQIIVIKISLQKKVFWFIVYALFIFFLFLDHPSCVSVVISGQKKKKGKFVFQVMSYIVKKVHECSLEYYYVSVSFCHILSVEMYVSLSLSF